MSEQPKQIGGAFRSGELPRLRDVPPELEYYAARAFTEGVAKYEAGLDGVADLYPWDKNWEKGDITFALAVIDHLKGHLHAVNSLVKLKLRAWETAQDPHYYLANPTIDGETLTVHLEHAAANLAMLCKFNSVGYFEDPPNPRTNGDLLGLKPTPPNPATIPAEEITSETMEEAPAREWAQPSLARTVLDTFGLGNILQRKG